MTQVLLILFVIFPVAEITMFRLVDLAIGLWPTVFLVVVTGVSGILVLNRAGLAPLDSRTWAKNTISLQDMVEATLMVVSGLLLVTPGFLTDALGLFLLIPSMRRTTAVLLAQRRKKHEDQPTPSDDAGESHATSGPAIDGEYRDISAGYDRNGQTRSC
ncbi:MULTISPECIES: FxsA family protein [unclassified Haematospirillum]|uniref:FxsA family protein n=1 Tax=unclassified Haematospirillum TaxID=2622088 RepID=UPI00143C0D91|nr:MULTISPECIES: FxsA family protein [unclassified Haematospirillum]NKD55572.1 FxsA family protein [Haematospirillum sp. H4890]NKD75711.1 FxsA family protein [Haematospirillum sp. H4485]